MGAVDLLAKIQRREVHNILKQNKFWRKQRPNTTPIEEEGEESEKGASNAEDTGIEVEDEASEEESQNIFTVVPLRAEFDILSSICRGLVMEVGNLREECHKYKKKYQRAFTKILELKSRPTFLRFDFVLGAAFICIAGFLFGLKEWHILE